MAAPNLHATCVVLGAHGLLIAGESGSGKTSLALALIEAWTARGRFARLVCDDQVLLDVANKRLIASAPHATRGLVEIFGLGPRAAAHLDRAVVDGLCRLVPDAPRFREESSEAVHGVALPKIELAHRNSRTAVTAISAWLDGFQLPQRTS